MKGDTTATLQWPLRVAGLLLVIFLYLPIVTIVLLSFSGDRHGQKLEGWTWEWYRALSGNEAAVGAIRQSLGLAVASTSIATVIGTAAGLGMSKLREPWRRRVGSVIQSPLIIPDMVLAVAFLVLAQGLRKWGGWFELGFGTMLVGHVTLQIPFVAMVVHARREGMDPGLEEAARDLGASTGRVFAEITLPLMAPGILAGALLAFALSLDDFVISFFTSGPGSTTLPILIHASVRRGFTPEIHALSTLLIVAAVVLTVLVSRFQRPTREVNR